MKSRKLVSSGPSCRSGRLSSTDRIACKVVDRVTGRYNAQEQAQIYATVQHQTLLCPVKVQKQLKRTCVAQALLTTCCAKKIFPL